VLGKFRGSAGKLVLALGASAGFRLEELSLRAVGSAPEASSERGVAARLNTARSAPTEQKAKATKMRGVKRPD